MPAIERRSVTSQVTRHIRAEIESGRLKDREALKTTRELARDYGVGPNTIDSALRPLIDEGLIIAKDRKGRYVNYPTAAADTRGSTLVIVIGGYAGSGKTELGRILSRMTNWPLLDKDSVTRPVTEVALMLAGQPPTDRESEIYLNHVRPAEYETLTLVMLDNITCGNNAIITAPFVKEFSDPAWFRRLEAACSDLSAKCVIVWVATDTESMRRYLRHRDAGRDVWKLAHWDDYLTGIDTGLRPAVEHHVISNSAGDAPLREQAAHLLRSLGIEPRPGSTS